MKSKLENKAGEIDQLSAENNELLQINSEKQNEIDTLNVGFHQINISINKYFTCFLSEINITVCCFHC